MTNLAVVLIGVLSLVNLALTFAVIRQLRRWGEQLRDSGGVPRQSGGAPRQPARHIQAGNPAPEFTATPLSGGQVSLSDLAGARSVIAFFMVGCQPCHAQLPEFTRYAQSLPGGAAQVLAVVLDREHPQETAADYTQALAETATVVVEPAGGLMATAFGVSGYPTIYVLDERGRVEASGVAVRQVVALLALA